MGRVRNVVGAAIAVPKKSAVGYWRGLTYPFKGISFVYFENPSLVRFWIVPVLITLVLAVGVLTGAWEVRDGLLNLLWEAPTSDGFWASLGRFFHGFAGILISALLMVVGLVLVYVLTSVFAAPFNDALSEEVEHLVAGTPGPQFSFAVVARDSVRAVGIELVKLVPRVLFIWPLWLIGLFIPVLGIVVSVAAWILDAFFMAVDYIDWPASRRNRGIGYRFGLIFRRTMPMLGFGTGVYLFLFIPVLNLFLMPAAVAGGTLLFLDVEGAHAGTDAPTATPAAPQRPLMAGGPAALGGGSDAAQSPTNAPGDQDSVGGPAGGQGL